MSALKQLKPFVRVCQISGLIPFTMETDPETKEFLKFGFSLKSATALWYFTILFFVIISFILPSTTLSSTNMSSIYENAVDNMNLSTVGLLLLGATQFSYMILFSIKRVTVLRYKHLRKAVALVKEVEQHLSDLPQCKNTVILRTVIGIIIAVVMVHIFSFYCKVLPHINKTFYTDGSLGFNHAFRYGDYLRIFFWIWNHFGYGHRAVLCDYHDIFLSPCHVFGLLHNFSLHLSAQNDTS